MNKAATDLLQASRWLEQMPEKQKIYMPKRIVAPAGYHPAGCVAGGLMLLMQNCRMKWEAFSQQQLDQLPPEIDRTAYNVAYSILKHGVPIYYVSDALARAVAATKPPPDFTVGDLHWPMEGMVLGFPVEFMKEYVGADICYINCAYLPIGTNMGPEPGMPQFVTQKAKAGLQYFVDVLDEKLEDPCNVSSQVSAYFVEDSLVNFAEKYEYHNLTGQTDPAELEADEKRVEKVTSLVYRLLLILASEPDLVETGACERLAHMKKGRLRGAIWSPNMIGAHYSTTKPKDSLGGTHATPMMHWRMGHMHRFAHGPGKTMRKYRWLKPILVNKPEDQ